MLRIFDLRAILYVGTYKQSVLTLDEPVYKQGKVIIPQIHAGGTALAIRKLLEASTDGADVIITTDSKTNFRKQISPIYKSTRNESFNRQELLTLVNVDEALFKAVMQTIGFHVYSLDNYEADDLIATAVKQNSKDYNETQLVAEDSDLRVLISENPKVSQIGVQRKFKPIVYSDEGKFELISISKVIKGDTTDDILPISMPRSILSSFMNLIKGDETNKGIVKTCAMIIKMPGYLKDELLKNIDLAYLVDDLDINLKPLKLDKEQVSYLKRLLNTLEGIGSMHNYDKTELFFKLKENLI